MMAVYKLPSSEDTFDEVVKTLCLKNDEHLIKNCDHKSKDDKFLGFDDNIQQSNAARYNMKDISSSDINQLMYSDFMKGITFKSTPIEQFENVFSSEHYRGGEDNFVSEKLNEGFLCKNKRNYHPEVMQLKKLNKHPKKCVNSEFRNEGNCGRLTKERLKRVDFNQAALGGHVVPVNQNKCFNNSVKKKISRLNQNCHLNGNHSSTCETEMSSKYFKSNKNILHCVDIVTIDKEAHGSENKCNDFYSCNERERTKILKIENINVNKRTNLDYLLLSKKPSKKVCLQDLKESHFRSYLPIEKTVVNCNEKTTPVTYENIECKKKLLNCSKKVSVHKNNSVMENDCEYLKITSCPTGDKKFVKAFENYAINENGYLKKSCICENNLACKNNILRINSNHERDKNGYKMCNNGLRLLLDFKKDSRTNICDNSCDIGVTPMETRKKIIKTVDNGLQLNHIKGNPDHYTLHVIYNALQFGYVRRCGFVKDIIPSMRNGLKEEAVQFSCKTCWNNFSYSDVKNSFIEKDLRCHCPNCSSGLNENIQAEFCFKFIIKDLRNIFSSYFLIGKKAESFFGCSVNEFWHNSNTRHLVRRTIRNLLRSYNRKILSEFCVSSKNLFNSGRKYIVNIDKKCCVNPMGNKNT